MKFQRIILLTGVLVGLFYLSIGCSGGSMNVVSPSPEPGNLPFPGSNETPSLRTCEVSTGGIDIFFEKGGSPFFFGLEYGRPWTNETVLNFDAWLHDQNGFGPNDVDLFDIFLDGQEIMCPYSISNGHITTTIDLTNMTTGPHNFTYIYNGNWFEVAAPLVVTWDFSIDLDPPMVTAILGNDQPGDDLHYMLFFDKPLETIAASNPYNWLINGDENQIEESIVFNGGYTADLYPIEGFTPLNNQFEPVFFAYEEPRGVTTFMIPPQDPDGEGGSDCDCNDLEVTCGQFDWRYEECENNAIRICYEWIPAEDPCPTGSRCSWTYRKIKNDDPYDEDIEDFYQDSSLTWEDQSFEGSLFGIGSSGCHTLTFDNTAEFMGTVEVLKKCDPTVVKLTIPVSFSDTIDKHNPEFETDPILLWGDEAAEYIEAKMSYYADTLQGEFHSFAPLEYFYDQLVEMRGQPCRLYAICSVWDIEGSGAKHGLPIWQPPFFVETFPHDVQHPEYNDGMNAAFWMRWDLPDYYEEEYIPPEEWCDEIYWHDGSFYNELELGWADVTDLYVHCARNDKQMYIRIEDWFDDTGNGYGIDKTEYGSGYGNWRRSTNLIGVDRQGATQIDFYWAGNDPLLREQFRISSPPSTLTGGAAELHNPSWSHIGIPEYNNSNIIHFQVEFSCPVSITIFVDQYFPPSESNEGWGSNEANVTEVLGFRDDSPDHDGKWSYFLIPCDLFIDYNNSWSSDDCEYDFYNNCDCNKSPIGVRNYETALKNIYNLIDGLDDDDYPQDYSPIFATSVYSLDISEPSLEQLDMHKSNGFGSVYSPNYADEAGLTNFENIYPIFNRFFSPECESGCTYQTATIDYYWDGRQWYFQDIVPPTPPGEPYHKDLCPQYPGYGEDPELEYYAEKFPMYLPPGEYTLKAIVIFTGYDPVIPIVYDVGNVEIFYDAATLFDPDTTLNWEIGSIKFAFEDTSINYYDYECLKYNYDAEENQLFCPDWYRRIDDFYVKPEEPKTIDTGLGTIFPGPYASQLPYHNIFEYGGHGSLLGNLLDAGIDLGINWHDLQTNEYGLVVLRACYTAGNSVGGNFDPPFILGDNCIKGLSISCFNAHVKVGWAGFVQYNEAIWNKWFHRALGFDYGFEYTIDDVTYTCLPKRTFIEAALHATRYVDTLKENWTAEEISEHVETEHTTYHSLYNPPVIYFDNLLYLSPFQCDYLGIDKDELPSLSGTWAYRKLADIPGKFS